MAHRRALHQLRPLARPPPRRDHRDAPAALDPELRQRRVERRHAADGRDADRRAGRGVAPARLRRRRGPAVPALPDREDRRPHRPPCAPGWPNPSSTLLPTTPAGEFDPLALFSAQFAPRYGFPDPAQPARALSLCELYEQGLVNEVWIQDGEPGVRRPPLYLERKQIYDERGRAVAGAFAPCAGGDGGCLDDILCGVTVRIAHLDPARGPGCDLEVRGWGIEGMWDALPAWRADADAFLNRDFDRRFGVRFESWSRLCDQAGTPCVAYPTATSATGSYADGSAWTIEPFRQGCGSTMFPPNATARWDVANQAPVDSRCAHFGLGDGARRRRRATSPTPPPRSPTRTPPSPTAAAAGRSTGARACPAPPPPPTASTASR